MSWWKDMGKTWVFKTAKQVGTYGAKGIKYGAPAIGALGFGIPGAAIGTLAGAAAAQVGPTKNKGNQFKNSLLYGASFFGANSLLNLVAGVPIGSSIFKSGAAIFGPSPAATAAATNNLPAFPGAGLDAAKAGAGGDVADSALQTAANAALLRSSGGNTAQLQQQYQDQLALARQLRAQGDQPGALLADAAAEAYRQAILAGGGAPSAGTEIPWGLILIGGGALFFLTRGKAA